MVIAQNVSKFLSNTSNTVKFICGVTIFFYLLSYSESVRLAILSYLAVTPGYLLPPSCWIWTAFTYCFIELHLWEVLANLLTIVLTHKLIEPLWGQAEILLFFIIVNFSVAILSSIYYLVIFVCTKDAEFLFTDSNSHIRGLSGYLGGICVAVRQVMPDLLIAKSRFGVLTNRDIPLTLVCIIIVLSCLGLLDHTFPVMFITGLLVSFIYLRFFQRHGNRSRGDNAENFTFASFFPRIVQPVITILVNPIHLCFLRLNVISSNPVELLPVTTNSVMISSFDPQNIERRRQIALKALSERLSKTNESNRQQLFQKQQQQQQQKMHTNLPSTSSAATTLVEIEQNSTAEQSQSKQFAGV